MIGVGSNLLVRDGGIPGVVVRLPSAFGKIETDGTRVRAGAAALDGAVARAAADAGIAGLEFLRGVPGTIGGALKMNAGCYGREIKDIFVEATAIDEQGNKISFPAADMGFVYRKARAPRRPDLCRSRVRRHAGRSRRHHARAWKNWSANREASPADQVQDRRLDVQESARPQGLAADRSSRLPRADAWRGAGQREAHATS